MTNLYVGCAGWSIPTAQAADFHGASDGTHVEIHGGTRGNTHLERYAQRLPAVEINSSFYRAHRPATYERWAQSVPDAFRFAVKVPRQITHVKRLREPEAALDAFLGEVAHLGRKIGPLLVQLPPSLAFDTETVPTFFAALRDRFRGSVVCEPRHASWFDDASAGQVLMDFRVARVAADPAPVPAAAHPGGWGGLVYYRLHGSPRVYYSDYAEKGPEYLETLAATLQASAATGTPTWCIFDNTATGAATANALAVLRRVHKGHERTSCPTDLSRGLRSTGQ